MKKRTAALFLSLLTLFCLVLGGCSLTPDTVATVTGVTLDDLPRNPFAIAVSGEHRIYIELPQS